MFEPSLQLLDDIELDWSCEQDDEADGPVDIKLEDGSNEWIAEVLFLKVPLVQPKDL